MTLGTELLSNALSLSQRSEVIPGLTNVPMKELLDVTDAGSALVLKSMEDLFRHRV